MTKDGVGMNKVRCLKTNCKFNEKIFCERGGITIIDSPLFPDLARCEDFQQRGIGKRKPENKLDEIIT